jgi:dCMP deaminase
MLWCPMKKLRKQNKHDEGFLQIAEIFAGFSHCVSHKVGAVLVKDGRIISTGYNGTPPGYLNCDDKFDSECFDREEHHKWSNNTEIHGELNALLFSARNGISVNGATMYSTLQPCTQCVKNMIQAGISRIVYMKEYDKNKEMSDDIREFLVANGVKYEQFKRITQ